MVRPRNETPRARPRDRRALHARLGCVYQPEPGKSHLIEEHITVAPGEMLRGAHFPTVMEAGHLNPAPNSPEER